MSTLRLIVAAGALAGLTPGRAAAPAVEPAVPAWAFVTAKDSPPPGGYDAVTLRRVPGSTVQRTDAELADLGRAIDWFPAAHPPMPAAVAGARGASVAACGFCHLPGGGGRVENAALAGVPAEYIRAQVAAFADGTRAAALPGWRPTATMTRTAHQVAPSDVADAARYFSRQQFVSPVRVVEAAQVPAVVPHNFILARLPGGATEPIAGRIVETPDDAEAFERRDPRVRYTAFVPPGSLERGAAVTARIGCAGCHGEAMKQWGAGRSPTYIFRQLLAFQTGARHDVEAAPMTAVAAQLTTDDMVAVAAYWGSLTP